MAHKKVNLPQKTCPVCQRPFTWRKKWEKDWEQVIYCSERCRRSKSKNDQINIKFRLSIDKLNFIFALLFLTVTGDQKLPFHHRHFVLPSDLHSR